MQDAHARGLHQSNPRPGHVSLRPPSSRIHWVSARPFHRHLSAQSLLNPAHQGLPATVRVLRPRSAVPSSSKDFAVVSKSVSQRVSGRTRNQSPQTTATRRYPTPSAPRTAPDYAVRIRPQEPIKNDRSSRTSVSTRRSWRAKGEVRERHPSGGPNSRVVIVFFRLLSLT